MFLLYITVTYIRNNKHNIKYMHICKKKINHQVLSNLKLKDEYNGGGQNFKVLFKIN